MTYTSFNPSYQGNPPWEISRPQPAVVALAEEGRFVGRVLDVGCGTGENALYLASRGHPVLGVDGAATAIERALAKARSPSTPASRRRSSSTPSPTSGRRRRSTRLPT